MKKKYLIVSLLIFISVLSCNFLEDAANNAGLTGNTTLDLPISYNLSSVSRTLETDYGITVSSVTVTVENDLFTYGPDVLTFDADTDVASGTIEDIVEGAYTVTLSAYMLDNDSNPVLVAEGIQTDVVIVSDQVTNVDISMSIVVGIGDLVVNGSIASIPRDGLVAEYLFNGDANDTSGNDNHGTVNGATLTTDRNGNANSAYIFDGVDDYIDSNLNASTDISFSIWLNTSNNSISRGFLGTLYTTDGGKDGWYMLHLGEGNGYYIYYIQGNLGQGNILVEEPTTVDVWSHLVITCENSYLRLFIDGVEIGSGMDLTATTDIHDSTIKIGRAETVSHSWSQWEGLIDDVRIYNRALTEVEIFALFNE